MASPDGVLDALGDGTRRAVLDLLRDGPRSVGDLAEDLPVSRPAVSQHLAVLRSAGLVVHRSVGTRRYYALTPDGLGPLRDWVESYWRDALSAFQRFAEDDVEETDT